MLWQLLCDLYGLHLLLVDKKKLMWYVKDEFGYLGHTNLVTGYVSQSGGWWVGLIPTLLSEYGISSQFLPKRMCLISLVHKPTYYGDETPIPIVLVAIPWHQIWDFDSIPLILLARKLCLWYVKKFHLDAKVTPIIFQATHPF